LRFGSVELSLKVIEHVHSIPTTVNVIVEEEKAVEVEKVLTSRSRV
jgi:hypothetical protein